MKYMSFLCLTLLAFSINSSAKFINGAQFCRAFVKEHPRVTYCLPIWNFGKANLYGKIEDDGSSIMNTMTLGNYLWDAGYPDIVKTANAVVTNTITHKIIYSGGMLNNIGLKCDANHCLITTEYQPALRAFLA